MNYSDMTKEQATIELKKVSTRYDIVTNDIAILREDLKTKEVLALAMEREGASEKEQDNVVFEMEDLEDEIGDLELEIEELEERGDLLWNLAHGIKEE